MPTATGLPKVGEIWQLTQKFPPDWKPNITKVRVLERGRGDYWSMRVEILEFNGQTPPEYHKTKLWVDPAYWFSKGELKYVGKE
jgi:hypothetical protein